MSEVWVSFAASLFGLQIATLLERPHLVFPLCAGIPGASLCVQISSYKDTSQIELGPTALRHCNLLTPLGALSLNPVTFGGPEG